MFVIIGWVVVLGCVFGVFIAHGGNMGPIIKALPWEMAMIGGATLGAFLVNNQMTVIKATVSGALSCFKGGKYTKTRYLELLALLYDILQKARKEGLMSIENDVEEPHNSPLFKKYPAVGSDHHVVEFITDYLRMMVSGNLNAHEIESLMDSEIETHHQEAHAPVAAIQRVAGALPAFGIVAAVLGVIKTMGSVGQPPAVLGRPGGRSPLARQWIAFHRATESGCSALPSCNDQTRRSRTTSRRVRAKSSGTPLANCARRSREKG
ncbi:MAG: motility-associated protein, partial [Betaproteobacteria bacterium]